MKRITFSFFVLAFILSFSYAHALEKEGKYKSYLGWTSTGNTVEVGPNHTFFTGEFTGTNFNDSGEGFLHETSFVCPGAMDTNKGKYNGHGYCVVTDNDGDKAFLAWKCNGEEFCRGDFQWTGGTGKYEGLSGDNTFFALIGIGGTAEGYSVSEGVWKLP
jgi:hypothetical protein